MSDVERAEADLALAKVGEQYDAAVEAYRNDPSDEKKAEKDRLAEQVVAARQAQRAHRDAGVAPSGDGVANPGSIEGSTEVNE